MKKKLLRIACILIGIVIGVISFFCIFMYCNGYRIIPVKYVTSLERTSSPIEEEYFYAYFTVYTAKEWISNEWCQDNFYHPEILIEELNKLDDNQRIVIAGGKRIKYFDWWSDEAPSITPEAVYYDEPLQNKLYFYTIDYRGTMIDYSHH